MRKSDDTVATHESEYRDLNSYCGSIDSYGFEPG